MWSDHETAVDFLGFHELVDSLELLIYNQALRPITIGVTGDWGSGKSSVLKMAMERIDALADDGDDDQPRIWAASFSPWMHEGYDDVKLALIDTILRKLDEVLPDGDARERLGALRDWIRRVASDKSGVKALFGTLLTLAGIADPSSLAGLPTINALGNSLIDTVPTPDGADEEGDEAPTTAFELRAMLGEVLYSLDGVIVVLVDDVDRCLPKDVVSTFEVMRLFSDIPNVVFVVAANKPMVTEAISAQYENLGYRRLDATTPIGEHYLEKMWQMEIEVPSLSADEVRVYLAMLCCDLYAPDSLEAIIQKVDAARDENQLRDLTDSDLMGMVDHELADEIRAQFERHLEWSRALSDVLATVERYLGNPRQIKRFANRLILAAERMRKHNDDVDVRVLAKLLFLADTGAAAYSRLASFVVAYPDKIGEWLAALENADTTDENLESLPEELTSWSEQPVVARWLVAEPPVADVDLRTYLRGVRRDPSLAGAGQMSKAEREILDRLLARPLVPRQQAVEDFKGLSEISREHIVAGLFRAISHEPRTRALDSVLAILGSESADMSRVADALRAIPSDKVPASLPDQIVVLLDAPLPDALVDVLETWAEEAGPGARKRAATVLAKLRGNAG